MTRITKEDILSSEISAYEELTQRLIAGPVGEVKAIQWKAFPRRPTRTR